MTTLDNLFKLGIILALAGVCILFGATIYEAFPKSMEWGLEVMGALILIVGIALVYISLLIKPIDYFKKKEVSHDRVQ